MHDCNSWRPSSTASPFCVCVKAQSNVMRYCIAKNLVLYYTQFEACLQRTAFTARASNGNTSRSSTSSLKPAAAFKRSGTIVVLSVNLKNAHDGTKQILC